MRSSPFLNQSSSERLRMSASLAASSASNALLRSSVLAPGARSGQYFNPSG
jgi:hypothetical protein